jgi:prepilin-type N-terminal cleavage/methylation domain-containing protein
MQSPKYKIATDFSKRQKGVSLIEILVVITVFSVLAILATRGVLLTLKGSRKSDSLGKVRENIDYSFAVMERNLRNADSISCPTTTQIAYMDKMGISADFSCQDLSGNGYIASSSARLTSDQVKITQCSFTCDAGAPGVPPSVTISITGTDANLSGIESARVSVTTKIFLRTY